MRSPLGDYESQGVEQTSGSKTAKYLTVIGSLVAVGFVAVTTYQNADSATSSVKTTKLIATEALNSGLVAGGRVEVPTYATLDDDAQSNLFELYASRFSKSYSDDSEKAEKYVNFQKFLKLIDDRNALEKRGSKNGALHGITKFADMGEAEFKAAFLGFRPLTVGDDALKKTAILKKYDGDVTSKDWSGTYTTDVKDQGYCGSCWAFSATEQIESDAIIAGLMTTSETLSPQQIVSCDSKDYGCSGGNTETAYKYVARVGGLTTDSSYPYTSYMGHTGTCYSNFSNKISVKGYTSLDSEESMIAYVLTTGPLSVCLDASNWSSYNSGIMSVCGTSVDHCVQAVGVNTEEGYWIVRNSWGDNWGIGGYIWLKTDSNTCNIAYDPTYTTVYASSTSSSQTKVEV